MAGYVPNLIRATLPNLSGVPGVGGIVVAGLD